MMKAALNYLIIVAATALLQLFMPWWVIVLVPFVVYLVRKSTPLQAYGVSLAAVTTVWLAYASFLHNASQGSISNPMAEIFQLPSATVLLGVSSLLSGLAAGFGGSTGALLRQVFVRETP